MNEQNQNINLNPNMSISGQGNPLGQLDAAANYRLGSDLQYEAWLAHQMLAESPEACQARLLREAPGMINAHRPVITDQVKPAKKRSDWRRMMFWK